MDEIKHGPHGAAEYHHHHTHAADSQHVGSHHLLTIITIHMLRTPSTWGRTIC